MIHPATELRFIDTVVGQGVFATAPIERGTITWVLDPLDQMIDPATLRALGPQWNRWWNHHTFGDAAGRRVLAWDFCRSMNHSCQPNCAGTDLGFEVALFDIEPGEELTNDYGTLHIEADEGFTCRCGREECRGAVRPDLAADGRLLPLLREAVLRAREVEQPLRDLLVPGWWERALLRLAAAAGEAV